jgi:uncharacterized protein YdhG (YjbR/CyaY superfamily)
MVAPKDVDDYLKALSDDRRTALEKLRATIRSTMPEATEHISYQMPAFKSEGRFVVWYAAFKDHYSLYPASAAVQASLRKELERYASGKGTIRFEYGKPLPVAFVKKVVKIRIQENARGATYRRTSA